MMDKSRTEQRMDKVIARVKKLQPDMMLVLRNQHVIMSSLREILWASSNNARLDTKTLPLLLHQIKQTDEAISKNRAKDE